MVVSKPEGSFLGRLVPLKRTKAGNPIIVEMPVRVQLMEGAADDLFDTLGTYTIPELKLLVVPPQFQSLLDAVIAVRQLMGGEGSI